MKTKLYNFTNIALFLLILNSSNLLAQISGVVNSYARVTNIQANVFTIDNIALAPSVTLDQAFGVGQKVLIIQMKGAKIKTNNNPSFGSLISYEDAGNYEYATVTNRTGNASTQTITLTQVTRSYSVQGAVQIVSVPQYTNITVTGIIQATPWSKTLGRGGIVTFEVSQTLTLQADINVSGQGFAGGSKNTAGSNTSCNNSATYVSTNLDKTYSNTGQNHAQKGESIADYALNGISGKEFARGAMLNGGGGGNSHNAGGGGGGNLGPGGSGGNGWTGGGNCGGASSSSGVGAYTLTYSQADNKIFMGGGGGGGQQNNGHASNGANGGGIILIRAYNLVVTGANPRGFYADGANASNTTGNDAAGGGGGGGAILLEIYNYSLSTTLYAHANGGNGGGVNDNAQHGAGGGGGTGPILTNINPPANAIFESNPGNASLDCHGNCNVKTGYPGGDGVIDYHIGWVIEGDMTLLPIKLSSFEVELKSKNAQLSWTTLSEENTDYFEIQKSTNLKDIEVLTWVKAQGNSSQPLNYQATDEQPLPGISYYRLKSVDIDKKVTYSNWISLMNLEQILNYQIYPNPSSDFINFEMADSQEKQRLMLLDRHGKLIHEANFQGKYTLQAQNLPKGVYLVRISSQKGVIQSEIVLY
ncbi:MAG: T9SS type A sorting domain-containing protein [Microscillaceae bacterium]|nr:T9SS type A sorting domain-containing protein [Microscillaceae bacterium]